MRLSDIAPRLALARDQWIAEQIRLAAERRRHAELTLKWERILAHRELQLVRAGAVGDPRYLKRRQAKLDQAKTILADLRRVA